MCLLVGAASSLTKGGPGLEHLLLRFIRHVASGVLEMPIASRATQYFDPLLFVLLVAFSVGGMVKRRVAPRQFLTIILIMLTIYLIEIHLVFEF